MERIWLKRYPPGIPAEIDLEEYRSLGELFDISIRKFGPLPAYVSFGTEITYTELERLSRQFGAYLQNVARLDPGARVALMMPNLLQYPVAMFGALRAGYTVVNCNPLYSPRELEHQLKDSGAEAIVIVENFAHVLEQVVGKTQVRHVITTQIGDLLHFPRGHIVNFMVKYVKRMVPTWSIPNAVPLRTALKKGAGAPWSPAKLGPEDVAFLQYTGGTTGVPKGAMLTHRNLIANVQQAYAWLKSFLQEGEETIVTALPLYHVFALTANCLVFFKIGARNVLIANPRDVPGLVQELRKHQFTVITGVNTLFGALLNHPDFAKMDFSHLEFCLAGGMAVQRAVAERWKEATGKPLIEAYGLTETSPAVTINPLDLVDYNGSVGLPVPSTEIAIRDDDGHDLSMGEAGELCVRGPQVMKGYWNRPDETAKVIMADGFLRTGDIATVDQQGFVRIVDRKKDMIVVSGFKVFPNELEGVVMLHPGVLEVGAVGIPDPNTGEAVKIVVVKRDPNLTAETLIEHCRKHLTPYKVPKHVEFRTELPKTPVGKVLRRALQ
ncbi:AMP-binding protein [Microvirga alba]|uniref:Long-chain-fatty-acid--CoA ligase n=1 Tax=Microvirga alba TaxID=2791025 RepID=A0A931FP97_9HYPH|nr:AMP-binding protein [Microvirga alba]MBF9234515.1 AMP-binding protein [Microvirga alba]